MPWIFRRQDYPVGESYIFVCQHGANECEGNMMITCAKNLTQSEDVFMAFSNCVMDEFTAAAAGPQVGKQWRNFLYIFIHQAV